MRTSIGVVMLLVLSGCGGPPDPQTTEETSPGDQYVQREATKSSRRCPDDVARVLGRAYFLSHPLTENELPEYVAQNQEMFIQGGPVQRCADALGERLVSKGIGAYDPDAYARVMEGPGPVEHAGKVADSINSGAVDLYTMGLELRWLSQTLPAGARGDWRPYATTATPTRQQLRQVLPMMNAMAIDEETRVMVNQIMRGFGPLVEESILMLARMMD